MKKILLLAATAMLLIANACQKENPTTQNTAEETLQMKQYLADTYGFKPESIVEEQDHFVVEGDQCFSIKDFWESYGMTVENEFMVDAAHEAGAANDRKHYRYTYLVTKTKTIKIRILTGVPQAWQNAIIKAVTDWNAMAGGLTFMIQYASSPASGVVNVSMKTLASDEFAEAYYPTSNGQPGSELHINPLFNSEGALNQNGKVGVIAHEIGHTLGIRHTDSGQGSLITNVSTSCKNNPDPNSVMSAEGDFYYGFTICDKQAYFALYPK
ncbi:MAG: hypothetical protein H7246_06485 [Phycisphaerae bacterium]|nr:hypothetical protein [Saprospiraceae bacterium]